MKNTGKPYGCRESIISKRNNKKIIAAFAAGGIIFSGITGFAVNTYLASNIQYTNDKTVAQALNDLYSKLPKGTITIEENGTYDVTNKATAIVQNLYTQQQYDANYNAGKNDNCVVKEFTARYNNGEYYHYDLGFNPSIVLIDWGSNVYSFGKSNSSELYSFTSSKANTLHEFSTGNNGFQIKLDGSSLDRL